MMDKKDIEEYHRLIKKLEESMKKKEKLYGQKENEELAESYKESVKQKKERDDRGHLDSFSEDLKNTIIKKVNKKEQDDKK
tara:strand:+ start:223 stop:465 length:243 start_codon:yes stop_codon:yes gene_type:complete